MATITVQVPDDVATAFSALAGSLSIDKYGAKGLLDESLHTVADEVTAIGYRIEELYGTTGERPKARVELPELAARLSRLAERLELIGAVA